MAQPLPVPIGERVVVGIGKETTFGSAVVPTKFPAAMDVSPTPKNVPIPRTSARGQNSQVYPATGAYEGKLSFEPECCPDTLPQLLAYAMGTQSAPSLDIVATTVTAAAITAATQITVASAQNIAPGEVITIGTNTGIAVASVDGLVVTLASGLTTQVASGAAVTCTSTTAYTSTLKLGTPLPTFTLQNNRVTDAVAYTGCKIDTLAMTLDPKKGMTAKFTIINQSEAKVTSPATPAYSALFPFLFETLGGSTSFNGVAIGIAGQAAVLGWDVTLANTIKTDYLSAANGREVMALPEQMKKVSGKLTLGFENDIAQDAFWGGSTGPAAFIPSASVTLFMVSTDLADATLGIPYMLTLTLAKCFIEAADVAQKPGSILQQVVTFEASQSVAGASDDLVATFVNTDAVAY